MRLFWNPYKFGDKFERAPSFFPPDCQENTRFEIDPGPRENIAVVTALGELVWGRVVPDPERTVLYTLDPHYELRA